MAKVCICKGYVTDLDIKLDVEKSICMIVSPCNGGICLVWVRTVCQFLLDGKPIEYVN